MGAKIDLTGRKFGKLLVLREYGRISAGKVTWLCKCDCGCEKVIKSQSLLTRNTESCGCLHRQGLVARNTKHGLIKNGGKRPDGYGIWCMMKDRCNNPKSERYSYYGGRGIKVCRRWMNSFSDFMLDMGQRPSKKHSIDRINVNLGYYKKNCRWATPIEQARNKRKNIKIRYNGRIMLLVEWAIEIGITQQHLRALLIHRSMDFVYKKYKK